MDDNAVLLYTKKQKKNLISPTILPQCTQLISDTLIAILNNLFTYFMTIKVMF